MHEIPKLHEQTHTYIHSALKHYSLYNQYHIRLFFNFHSFLFHVYSPFIQICMNIIWTLIAELIALF